MYKKILALLDGSKFAECILPHVSAIATGCQVPEIVLLRIVEPIMPTFEEATYQQLATEMAKQLAEAEKKVHDEADNYLVKVADGLKKEGLTVQTALVRTAAIGTGHVTDEILDYAKKNLVDLIIMSTHGQAGGRFHWTLGSIAERVLRHSVAPVLVVTPAGCRTG